MALIFLLGHIFIPHPLLFSSMAWRCSNVGGNGAVLCRALLSAVEQLSLAKQRLLPFDNTAKAHVSKGICLWSTLNKRCPESQLLSMGSPRGGEVTVLYPQSVSILREQFGSTKRKAPSLLWLLWAPDLISITRERDRQSFRTAADCHSSYCRVSWERHLYSPSTQHY